MPADEEAIISSTAVVRWISKWYKQHLGWPFEIGLITLEQFGKGGSANRFFGSISIRRKHCGACVYLSGTLILRPTSANRHRGLFGRPRLRSDAHDALLVDALSIADKIPQSASPSMKV